MMKTIRHEADLMHEALPGGSSNTNTILLMVIERLDRIITSNLVFEAGVNALGVEIRKQMRSRQGGA